MLAPFEFDMPGDMPAMAKPAPEHAAPAALRVEALHGAQQQSEFFVSLGQYDEAVAVLADYLRECSDKPVLVFLELFRIYHGVGMPREYEALQAQFHDEYGFDAPSFEDHRDDHREDVPIGDA